MFNRWSPGFRADQVRSRKRLEDEGLHEELEERFRKTMYYGELPDDDDCPSLPLTNLAVDYFKNATPRGLGHINMSVASSLSQDAYVSPGSLVTSMIYAKRLRNRNHDYLQKMSSSDLFFISVMMASKYMYDEGVDEEVFNDEWAEAANLDLDEVNQMERDFLSAMDWQLFVSQSEFLNAVHALERRIAWTESCSRGWLSYTDMDVLWRDKLGKQLWEDIAVEWLKVMTVSSAAYIAGILTMLGSTALALQLSTTMVGCLMLSQPHLEQPITTQAHLNEPITNVDSHELPINTKTRFEMATDLPTLPWNDSRELEVHTSNHSESMPKEKSSSRQNLLETVLPQLWAVVAFKDRFVHLMCAFSEGIHNMASERYLRKMPKLFTSCMQGGQSVSSGVQGPPSKEKASEDLSNNKCRLCPHCRESVKSTKVKSCPILSHDDDNDGAVDLDGLESNLNLAVWCCHGNRPPESLDINLDMLQYRDLVRGFTTSVPVAA